MRQEDAIVRRTVIATYLLAGAAIVACIAWFAVDTHEVRGLAAAYREDHSPAKIVGRTAAEVIARFGKPDYAERSPNGEYTLITYKQPETAQYCGIWFEHGAASKVSFSFQ